MDFWKRHENNVEPMLDEVFIEDILEYLPSILLMVGMPITHRTSHLYPLIWCFNILIGPVSTETIDGECPSPGLEETYHPPNECRCEWSTSPSHATRDCMASVTPATRSRPGRRHAPAFRSAWRSPRLPRRSRSPPADSPRARGGEGSPRSPTRPVRRRIARHTIAHDRFIVARVWGDRRADIVPSRQTSRPAEVCRTGQSTTPRTVRDARKKISVDSEGGGGRRGGCGE
jgi:hypothetical protein